MFDELSLLEAETIEKAEQVSDAVSAGNSLPAPDFTGSLDYIDSLASRRGLAIGQRDALAITTALSTFDYISPLVNPRAVPGPVEDRFSASTDFRPLRDARRFDFETKFSRRPAGLVRSSSSVVAPSIRNFPPAWRNPLDPERDIDDLNRTFKNIERRISRKPFAFQKPNQVVICLKRKIRRNVMHALGFAGISPRWMHKPRYNYWSRVIC